MRSHKQGVDPTAARTHKPPRGLELLRPAARSARTETQPPCALYSTLRARRAASQHDREKAPAAAAGAPQIPTRNTNTGAAAPLNRRPLGTRRENMQMQQERCEKLGQAATKQLDREGRAKGRRGELGSYDGYLKRRWLKARRF